MAPRVGFEPTTNRLTADRSTTELPWNNDEVCIQAWRFTLFQVLFYPIFTTDDAESNELIQQLYQGLIAGVIEELLDPAKKCHNTSNNLNREKEKE